MSSVGFIGLGAMGAPMARNLIRAGHRLRVYDVRAAGVEEAAALGAVICLTPSEVLFDAEHVLTMVPDGDIVSSLLTGKDGLLAQAKLLGVHPIFIDCSTISPVTARSIADEANGLEADFADAPVSGGVTGARDATLTIMVGARPDIFSQLHKLLLAMAQAVFHAGDVGSGQATKICNNMLAAVIMAGTSEALALGEKLGLDPMTLSQIVGKSSGASFLLERWNPYPGLVETAPSGRNYENGFQLQLMLKDLGLALAAAQKATAPVPMGSAAQSLYALKAQEGAEVRLRDFSIVLELFRGLHATAARS